MSEKVDQLKVKGMLYYDFLELPLLILFQINSSLLTLVFWQQLDQILVARIHP
jgi:hypothetical protein